MLPVPAGQLADVQQQAKLVVDAGVARVEAQQRLFPPRQGLVGKRRLAIEDRGFAHAAQSFRGIPKALLA